jgi:hypothetical protein
MKNFTKRLILSVFAVLLLVPLATVKTAQAGYPTPELWKNSKEVYFEATADHQWEYYYFTVPAGTEELRFDAWIDSSGMPGPELYVREGSDPPTCGSDPDDCSNGGTYTATDSRVDGNDWYLSVPPIANPTPGTWCFGIYGNSIGD